MFNKYVVIFGGIESEWRGNCFINLATFFMQICMLPLMERIVLIYIDVLM